MRETNKRTDEARGSAGRPARKAAAAALGALFLALAGGLLFAALAPVGAAPAQDPAWTPLRDDALAAAYAPLISSPERFGPLVAVYYRAARAADGSLRIAYHPVWAYERNGAAGIGPFLSRILYTGGLSLQRLMFGKGDVEAIALDISPDGAAREAEFEMARSYSEKDFSVTHEKARLPLAGVVPGARRAGFETVSWNHLFVMGEPSAEQPGYALRYFDEAAWRDYGMTKNPPTRLFRHRAHFAWELDAAP